MKLTINHITDAGKKIVLSDFTKWNVHVDDVSKARWWMTGNEVEVTFGRISNRSKHGESVRVERAR
jgi:hypothetical protein